MDGDYEADDLGAMLAVATANARNIEESRGMLGAFNWLGDRLLAAAHATRSNTLAGSRRNIEEHYDAGGHCCQCFNTLMARLQLMGALLTIQISCPVCFTRLLLHDAMPRPSPLQTFLLPNLTFAGNDMYKLFLDDSMTYSCGIWGPGEACFAAHLNLYVCLCHVCA